MSQPTKPTSNFSNTNAAAVNNSYHSPTVEATDSAGEELPSSLPSFDQVQERQESKSNNTNDASNYPESPKQSGGESDVQNLNEGRRVDNDEAGRFPDSTLSHSIKLNVHVKDNHDHDIVFNIKPTTKLRKLMDAFCKHTGVDPKSSRFFFDGTRVQPDSTALLLGLEDGDCIDAHQQQIGGSKSRQEP